MDDLYKEQEYREAESYGLGIDRYFKNVAAVSASETQPGNVLLTNSGNPEVMEADSIVMRLAGILRDARDLVESGKAGSGRPALAMTYLSALDMPVVAYITVRTVVNRALRQDMLVATAMSIARQIEDQYEFDQLKAAEPALANAALRKAEKWTTAYHRRTIIRGAAKIAEVKGLAWTPGDKLKLGLFLFDKLVTNWTENGVRMIEQQRVHLQKNRSPWKLFPSEQLADWMTDAHNKCAVLTPHHVPMLVPPRDWTGMKEGGYLTEYGAEKFVRDIGNQLRDELMSVRIGPVYAAANSVQRTPWRINKDMYNVIKLAWDEGSTIGDMPPADPLPIPARPADIPRDMRSADMNDEQIVRFAAWRKLAATQHNENATFSGRRCSLLSQLLIAEDLIGRSRFWFPHSVDFRGRMYSISPELNPQANDIGKSMLEFAEGKPLGETGGYWLAVHVANQFGIDKISFEDRVAWVQENNQYLLDSAANPLDGLRFWATADKPWCALAACMEWAGWQAEGEDYVSHIPVAMDGSCSGLQHFSAMLRDAEGAQAVNLSKQDVPADLYTQVQERTEELLLEVHDNLAFAWRLNVTRKIVKRPCMTFAYSVTSRGIRDQILDELHKATGSRDFLPGFMNWEAASYLAPIVETAIRDTVERAAEAMDWLKATVRLLLESDRQATWSTPLGFVVQQRYNKQVGHKYDVLVDGQERQLILRIASEKADIRKQCAAIAPNFVHSMDACHLQLVVNRMVSEGVTTDFAVIHDSFGVHACDVDELHYVIRDEFIKLYSTNQLEKFRNWALSALPEDKHGELLPVPEEGDFNIEEVRDADFFFA